MKARIGFVANSSSASFMVKLDALNEFQVWAIHNQEKVARELLGWDDEWDCPIDEWEIISKEPDKLGMVWCPEDEIRGTTSMDNFNMAHFLSSIRVPKDQFEVYGECETYTNGKWVDELDDDEGENE